MQSTIEAIREEVAKMPLKIGLSQFGLANHPRLNGAGTCYTNEGLVQGPFNALQRTTIAGTIQNLSCTGCGALFSDVKIPAGFH